MSKVVERFLKYVSFDTQSDPQSNTVPTTSKQVELAKYIVNELKEIGMSNVTLDDKGYVMAEIPGNCEGSIPTIGFIAHMDTSPEMNGKDVKTQIIKKYDGGDIVLNKENNIVLSPSYYSDLLQYKGEDIITTDGTTLLGADDKAGIAEIVTAMEYLLSNPKVKHGTIKVGFTPDEEVGRGADYFDVEKFAADFAYTMDGSHLGEFEFENFNAAGATVTIHGRNVHPGYAKNKMINSLFIAQDFISRLPLNERPETTEGYEGFYHLDEIHGATEETKIEYIIRDFNKESFEKRKTFIKEVGEQVNKKYGEGTVEVKVTDQYYNMREKVEPVKHVIDNAVKAMEEIGITPKVQPIRGGTDGARLSFMGLPTPNIFAGGVNFHSKYEFVPVVSLEKAVEVILKIVDIYTRA